MNLEIPFSQFFSLFLLVNIVQCKVIRDTNDGPIVQTNVGSIRGVRADGGNYNMFMGIPYARVNESNVFGDPIPYPPFQEVFQADDDSAICPQVEEFNRTIVGSLDCLHLNVYVPDSASAQNRLPVMVYIYGGGFTIGFAGRFLYGPQFLVRHDVILVTLNYRLGPYGFMCLNTPEVPGNAGLKDQVTALRWVKENIQFFGGDADKVTVFGNSAGGMSIGLHLISENEKLFSNAVMQSGSAFLSSIVQDGDPSSVLRLAAAAGFQTNDINAAIQHLSDMQPHRLMEVQQLSGISWVPCVEREFTGVERFLSQRAINSDHSKAENVSVLLGYNSDELIHVFPYSENPNPEMWATWPLMFAMNLQNDFNFEESKLEELSGIVRRFYIGDAEANNDIRGKMANFVSDNTFVYPTIRSIKRFLEAGTTNVYQYVFSHDGQRNFVKVKDGVTETGAVHADEIGYLFEMEFIPQTPVPEDQLIIDRMTTMWTNFAKYGDPTPQITTLLPVKWEPITKGSPYHFINIHTTMTTGARFEYKRMSFWDLFYEAHEEYERGFISPNDKDDDDDDDDGNGNGDGDGDDGSNEDDTDSAVMAYLSPALLIVVMVNLF